MIYRQATHSSSDCCGFLAPAALYYGSAVATAVQAHCTARTTNDHMYVFDLTTVLGYLKSVWQLAMGALSLDPAAFVSALTRPGGTAVTLGVLFLGGLSYTLGRSVVLFANRVSRPRFFINLLVSAGALVASVFIWSGIIWLIAEFFFGVQRPFSAYFISVSLSYAPLLYGFLILLPYLGKVIFYLLRIWVLLANIVVVAAVFNLGLPAAVLCCLLGWLAIEIISIVPFLNPDNISDWLWRVTTGTPHQATAQELADDLAKEIQGHYQRNGTAQKGAG